MEQTYWDKKEPASVYEASGYNAIGLLSHLDMKLLRIACNNGDAFADRKFRKWLNQEKNNMLGMIFQASELMGESVDPLRILIISDFYRMEDVAEGLRASGLSIFEPYITDPDELCEDFNAFEPSAWRAILSGELLVGGRSSYLLDSIIDQAKEAQEIFEYDRVLEDLAYLVAHDVSKTVC